LRPHSGRIRAVSWNLIEADCGSDVARQHDRFRWGELDVEGAVVHKSRCCGISWGVSDRTVPAMVPPKVERPGRSQRVRVPGVATAPSITWDSASKILRPVAIGEC